MSTITVDREFLTSLVDGQIALNEVNKQLRDVKAIAQKTGVDRDWQLAEILRILNCTFREDTV